MFKGGKVRFDPVVIRQKWTEGITPNQIAPQLGCNPATVFRALHATSPANGTLVRPTSVPKRTYVPKGSEGAF